MKWVAAMSLGLLALGAFPLQAQSSVPLQLLPEDDVSSATVSPLTPEQRQQIQALKKEIQDLEQQAQTRIQALNSSGSSQDQRSVERIKVQTQIEVLKLRRRIAEIRGDKKLVTQYSASLQQMEHPGASVRPAKSGPRPTGDPEQTR